MLSALTIAQAHDKLRSKECSSEDLVRSCIEQIEKVDGKLNAVVHRNFDSALTEAKKLDTTGAFEHPLSGIPFLVKDVFAEVGVPTTGCSNMLRNKDYVSPYESTSTGRCKMAGAISLGKVNTDEFTMGASTETSCYGVTKNPWDTTRVAGGSSGGSAAAVAADECLFSLGTDTGGSIRQPASFCGCVGLRPTFGRTSRYGAMRMAGSLDTTGPLCKTVEDIAIVLQAIAGVDNMDATTGDKPVSSYREDLKKGIQGMTIGLPKEYFIEGLSPDIEHSIRAAAKVLEGLGANIVDVSLPHTKYAVTTYYVICPCEVSSNMARYDGIRFGHTVKGIDNLVSYYHATRTEGFGPEVKRRIMIGTYALSAGYYDAFYRQAQKVRTLIIKDFTEAFAKVDAIIAPTTPNPAFKIGAHTGDPVAMYLEDVFAVAQPMAGIPALSVTCGFTKENLPIGLQVMGPQWGESTILRIAHAYEQAAGFLGKKPTL